VGWSHFLPELTPTWNELGEKHVLKALLLTAAIAIFSFGAANAQTAPVNGPASPAALNIQMQEPSPADRSAMSAPRGDLQPTRQSDRTAPSLAKDLWSLVRTSALLALAGLVIGLSAVGVRSLWVADQTEYTSHDIMDYRSGAHIP
jgi:hypothetical protein